MAEGVSSVARALRILDLLRDREVLGVTDVAKELGIGSSSAHRLLQTLQAGHYVRQASPGRKYRLGPFMEASVNGPSVDHCVEVALPLMEKLRDDCGETVHIAVLQRTQIKFVAAMESHQTMRVTNRAGQLLPANATAAGKLLLSLRPEDEVSGIFTGARAVDQDSPALAVRTPFTVGELDGLQTELARTMEAGFGRQVSEAEIGVAALAVPIRRPEGPVLCALTLTGPDTRMDARQGAAPSATELELLRRLRATAEEISAHLEF